jgi:hypothetical protein
MDARSHTHTYKHIHMYTDTHIHTLLDMRRDDDVYLIDLREVLQNLSLHEECRSAKYMA